MGILTCLRGTFCGYDKCGTWRVVKARAENDEKMLMYGFSRYYHPQNGYSDDENYHDDDEDYYSDDKLHLDDDDDDDNEVGDEDGDQSVNQAADKITSALLTTNNAVIDGPQLQRTVDDILLVLNPHLRFYNNDNNEKDISSNSSSITGKVKIQSKITRKWIRAVARAVLHRLEKIVARVLAATTKNNRNSNSSNTENNEKKIHDSHHHHHHHHGTPMPKMGKAMHHAFERALEGVRIMATSPPQTGKALLDLPRDHPVWCALVVLGMLVPLAPWALEALGFAEAGPVAGSFAAWWQSTYGDYVDAKSLFAFLQRLGMVWRRRVGRA